jgi:hypothetical protein
MSDRVMTISARFTKEHVETLKRLQEELGCSQTDVLHLALDYMGGRRVISGSNTQKVALSADALKRASRLHDHYGYGISLQALLSEAVELGLREIRKKLVQDRKEDADLARVDMDARSIEMQQDSMTN